MKLNLGQIVNSKDALQELLNEKLPIKIAFKVKEIFGAIDPKLGYYEEMRSKLIMGEYGEQDGDSGNWKVKQSKMKEFVEELKSLMSVELDLDITKVRLPENILMTPSNAYLLGWMIDFEDEENG